MWRDVGGRIPVESYYDSTQEGGRDTTAMEHTGHKDLTPDLQDVVPGKGRTAEMFSGGVPGQSGDKFSNAGALCAPECPRHHGDYGGRRPPPPTVRPMKHAGPPEGLEQAAPGHSKILKGGGVEETTAGGGGDAGEFGAGV